MTRTFFDADKALAEMQAHRPAILSAQLAVAKTERDRALALAQDAMFPALMDASRVMVELRNAGRDDAFIGVVFGAFVGNVIVTLTENAVSPEAAATAFERAVDFVSAAHSSGQGMKVTVPAVPGGAA